MYIDYYSFTDPEGIKAKLAWLTHSKQCTHELVTCEPQIGPRTGNVRQPKTDVLITELHCQPNNSGI